VVAVSDSGEVGSEGTCEGAASHDSLSHSTSGAAAAAAAGAGAAAAAAVVAGDWWLSREEASMVQRFQPDDPLDTIGFFIAKFAKKCSCTCRKPNQR
jgi:hypothetical protein